MSAVQPSRAGRPGWVVVPRLVDAIEDVPSMSPSGMPLMTTRQVVATEHHEFSLVDYAKWMQTWVTRNYPLNVPLGQRKRGLRPTAFFGLVFLLCAVITVAAGQGSNSNSVVFVFIVFAILGIAFLAEAAQANWQAKDPVGFAQAQALAWRGDAYRSLENGHPGWAMYALDQSVNAAAHAQQQSTLQAAQHAARQHEHDRFWVHLQGQSLAEQWATVEWLRTELGYECARRAANGWSFIEVPDYYQAAAWLTANPSRW